MDWGYIVSAIIIITALIPWVIWILLAVILALLNVLKFLGKGAVKMLDWFNYKKDSFTSSRWERILSFCWKYMAIHFCITVGVVLIVCIVRWIIN